ncbi:MAG: GTP-binding protein [Rhodoferax sp.]|nr:GTP-binding protein [Rhodoferax sp.]MDD2882055.1 GTP-binding protein [Rhodoferax sp.]
MGAELGSDWKKDETRNSKMVFIGKDLPQELLEKGLAQCIFGAIKSKAT